MFIDVQLERGAGGEKEIAAPLLLGIHSAKWFSWRKPDMGLTSII